MNRPVDATLLRWAHVPALTLLAALLVTLHAAAFHQLSAVDEFQHFDSVVRATHLEVVRTGDRITQYTLGVAACRGIDRSRVPPCGSAPYNHSDFPGDAVNTADQDSPVYYFATAAVAEVLLAVHLAPDLFVASRLAGSAWLAAGLVLLWELCLALGASRPAAAGVCLLVGATPNVLVPAATSSSDATALVAGGLVGLLACRPRWGPGSSALVTLLKVQNLLAVGALSLAGLFAAAVERRRRAARVLHSLALVASGLAAEAAWLVIRKLMAPAGGAASPIQAQEQGHVLTPGDLGTQLANFLTSVQVPYLPPFLAHPFLPTLITLQNAALLGGLLAGALLFGLRTPGSRLSAATALAALLGAPGLMLVTYLLSHSTVPAAPRYGLSLVPVAGALLAAAARSRLAQAALLGLGALSVGVVVFYAGSAVAEGARF